MKKVSQEIYDWWDQVVPIAQLFIVVICWAWGVDGKCGCGKEEVTEDY
tara:strand:+ start:66 stop:209 length:144 start_codon:yes stop_codon:yes gene_type:complete